MERNNKASDILYVLNITARLVAVCAVIALLVATVNYFAAPVIEENKREETRLAIEQIFGEGVAYTETEIAPTDNLDAIYSVSSGQDFLGYCAKLSPAGFKGDVDLLVAFDGDGFVTNVKITSTNSETAGIGTKVKEAYFLDAFLGLPEGKGSASDYVISGATKTSRPVAAAILEATDAIGEYINTQESEATANE